MSYSSILVISDNESIITDLIGLLKAQPQLSNGRTFKFACHPKNEALNNKQILGYGLEPLDVKRDHEAIANKHDLIISAHCKQIFPAQLVNAIKCINIHPGYNPYNRGWYPQVFSIINSYPAGATIHEIDAKVDHGKIIDRERVEILASDTSLTAYNRIQAMELKLLERNLQKILDNAYDTLNPEDEGNINFRKDFDALREIKLDENITYQQAINRLRALSHPPFKNAYFIDPETGKRIWIQVTLQPDEEDE